MKGVTTAQPFPKPQHQAVLKMVGFAGSLHSLIAAALVFPTLWWNINDSNVEDSAAKSPPVPHPSQHPSSPVTYLQPGKAFRASSWHLGWHLRADFRLAFISEIWVWLDAWSWGSQCLPAQDQDGWMSFLAFFFFFSLPDIHSFLYIAEAALCFENGDYTCCAAVVHVTCTYCRIL